MLDNIHLRLFDAQRLMLPPGAWNTANVRSAFWRFYWNLQDGAWLETDDGPYPLRGHTPYFVPAGVHFDCHNSAEVEHFYVHFDVLGLPRPTLRELFSLPVCLPASPQVQADVAELARSSGDLDLAGQCQIKSLLYRGLTEYLRGVEPTTLARCGRLMGALAPVLPAIEYIEDHLDARLTNAALAALCHLNTEHFIRRFHALVGQPPAQYVIERRVTIAAQRLLFTEDSIERIADATGFGNRSYFSRVFTRQMGIAPAAFRKSKRV